MSGHDFLKAPKYTTMGGMENETAEINHDVIAHLAYRHWESDGRPHGRDRDYWLEAEQQLEATKHLLLVQPDVIHAAAPRGNGNGRPSSNDNGQAGAAKSKARIQKSGRGQLVPGGRRQS